MSVTTAQPAAAESEPAMGTMLAARAHALGEPLRVEEVPIPDIGPGETLVKVLRAGINRGDEHMIQADLRLTPDAAITEVPVLPMIMGHDGCGEVVAVGPGVRVFAPGDKVIVKCILTCGFCKFCRSEREHLCEHHRVMGYLANATEWGTEDGDIMRRYKDGTWAEYVRVPTTNLYKLRPDDDLDQMSMVSQIAVCYRMLKRCRLHSGETVLIVGATGITGVGGVLSALAMGAARVIAVARDEARLERLRAIDPRRIATISSRKESVRERVRELTDGTGVQVYVDLTPSGIEVVEECLHHCLERGARVGLVGGNTEVLKVGYRYLMIRSIEIFSSNGRFYADIPELVELARCGLLDLSYITRKFYALEDVNTALRSLDKPDRSGELWPVMVPNGVR